MWSRRTHMDAKTLKTGRKLARSLFHLIYSCRSIYLPAHQLDTAIKIK